MPPPIDGSDNFVGIGGPDKRLWFVVRLSKKPIDGGLEIDDGAEDAALEAAAGQLGEVAFDRVEPRGGCWGEVENETGMALEPGADLGMLVGRVVVENYVDAFRPAPLSR